MTLDTASVSGVLSIVSGDFSWNHVPDTNRQTDGQTDRERGLCVEYDSDNNPSCRGEVTDVSVVDSSIQKLYIITIIIVIYVCVYL